jgi:hypothetical protein
MLLRAITDDYSKNYWKNDEIFNDKACGTHSHYCDSNVYNNISLLSIIAGYAV